MAACYLDVIHLKKNNSVMIKERIFFSTILLMHDCEEERQFIIDFYYSAFGNDE